MEKWENPYTFGKNENSCITFEKQPGWITEIM